MEVSNFWINGLETFFTTLKLQTQASLRPKIISFQFTELQQAGANNINPSLTRFGHVPLFKKNQNFGTCDQPVSPISFPIFHILLPYI